MRGDFSYNFYGSYSWKKVRQAYMSYVHGLCERCQMKSATTVHHKVYLTPQNINDPSVTLSFSNLEALCTECHIAEHGNESTANGLMFDDCGNLIAR